MILVNRMRMMLCPVLFFGIGTAVSIGQTPSGESKPKGDAEFLRQVQVLSNRLSGLKSYSVTIQMKQIVQKGTEKQEHPMTCRLALQRPGAFFLELHNEGPLFAFASDSHTQRIYSGMLKQYTDELAAATVDVLLEGPGADELLLDSFSTLLFLLSSNPENMMLKQIESGRYAGEEKMGDKTVQRLQLKQKEFDWDIWSGGGETEFPVTKIVETLNPPAGSAEQPRVEIVMEFKTESLNAELPMETFRFSPPADSQKARYLGDQGPHPLEGKPAPDFLLELLDGTKKNLSELKGKVVVLDFWATWCGPCRQGLPMVEEIMQATDSSAAVSFAVNQRESAEKIQSFLKKTGLKLTVARDAEGEIGTLYHVNGIPQTVLIDKQGIIQCVHVGLSPFFKSTLKRQVFLLVRNQKLFETPSAPAP